MAASAALALYLGWRSWPWPLVHDAPLMHYVAWLMTRGAVLLFTLQEMIWARFIYLHQLLFGAIIITVVLLMPRGILGVLQQKYNLPRTI